LIQFSLRYSF